MEINCLSIQQPWIWCIFNAGKNVENRTWRTNYRGKLFLQASKKFDHKAYEYLQANKEKYGIKNMPTIEELKEQTGGFVGVVDLTRCRKNLQNNIWKQPDSYGWVFDNPTKLNFTPANGRLGIFKMNLNPELKNKLGL